MTRRERLERKLDKRQDWALSREQKSEQYYNQATAISEHIPFGQPILVGHHSERHARRNITRIDSAMRNSIESRDMAAHHREKAHGLEIQLKKTTFSDDPDAIEQLTEKINKAQKNQDLMRAANKIIKRKPSNESTPDKVVELLGLDFKDGHIQKLFTRDFCGRYGFPDYVMTGNSANIRRLKKRIEDIQRRENRTNAAQTSQSGILIEGTEYIRVTFSEKPEYEIISALKAAGFRWSGGSWLGYRDKLPENIEMT